MTIFEWNDTLFKIVYEINNIIKIMMPLTWTTKVGNLLCQSTWCVWKVACCVNQTERQSFDPTIMSSSKQN